MKARSSVGRSMLAAVLLALSGVGCFSAAEPFASDYATGPIRAVSLERAESWRAVAHAEALHANGQDRRALQMVEGVLAEEPLFVPAFRLRQNILRERGREGLLWDELETLRARYPDRSEPLYLEARLIPELKGKQRFVADGLSRFPDSYWLKYAAAWSLARMSNNPSRKRAKQLLEDLVEVGAPWIGPIAVLRAANPIRIKPAKFLPRIVELARQLPDEGRLDLMIYADGAQEISRLLSGIEKRPSAPELTSVLRRLTGSNEHGRAVVRYLERRSDVADKLVEHGFGLLIARLASQHGEPALAEAWLERSCRSPRAVPALEWRGRLRDAVRELMSLRVKRGDLAGAIDLWETKHRPGRFDDGRNRVTERLAAVLRGPARNMRGKPASVSASVEVLHALLRAGWVEEAALLARFHLRTFPDAAAIRQLRDEAERFLLFEEAFADFFGGPMRQKIASGEIEDVLDRLRALSQRVLGRDVVGEPRLMSFPILAGTLLDPFGPGLPAFFERYNRHMILGSLTDRSVAVLLGIKLRDARLQPDPSLPLTGTCREIVIESKRVSTAAEAGIADPAGIALWNHYVLDLRAMQNWVADLERVRDTIEREGYDTVANDPVAAVPALDMTRPGQVNWKLTARAMNREGTAWDHERTWREVYKLLQVHERAHLVDAHRFLPVMSHIGPALFLFAAAGFSPKSLLANLEGRADCAALALGADPVLALGHLAGFVSEPHEAGVSAHQVGFKRILRRVIELWQEDGAPGAVHADRNLLAQLHRIPRERALEYGKQVLREERF